MDQEFCFVPLRPMITVCLSQIFFKLFFQSNHTPMEGIRVQEIHVTLASSSYKVIDSLIETSGTCYS